VKPAVYECTLRHVRTTPVRHAFRYRTYLWLVDLDEMPPNRWLAGFDDARTIRRGVDEVLAGERIARVLMLTGARVLGHVFNPLTVLWCHRADGSLAAVIAEVHNTYGGRHRYLLRPDARGRADVAKEFYVSPFFEVDGAYRMSVPVPGDRLDLTVALDHDGGRPFVASLHGRRRAVTAWSVLRQTATLAVLSRIKFQGVRLYLRGLPVVAR
jgi:uncharacterized protein